MKIGITTDSIDSVKYLKGVANYTKNVVKGIVSLGTNHSLYLVHFRQNDDEVYKFGINEILVKPLLGYNSFSKLLTNMFRQSLLEDLDVIHVNFPDTYQFPLFYLPIKKILTVHDLLNLYIPPEHSYLKAKVYNNPKGWIQQKLIEWWFPRVKEKIDAHIVTSNFLKKKLVECLSIPEERIWTVYEGVNHQKFKPLNISPSSDFILTESPFSELIKVYYKLKKRGIKHKLVIFSKRGYGEEAKRLVNELSLQKDVIFTGYVPEQKLVELYNTAAVFVRLDEYDAFNLPSLEAMACGCPVVLHNIDAAPEVFGDAAVLVSPFDVDKLTDAIYGILTNGGLREGMIKKGLERAKMFSWEKTTKETIKVYEEVCDANS